MPEHITKEEFEQKIGELRKEMESNRKLAEQRSRYIATIVGLVIALVTSWATYVMTLLI